MKIRKAIIPAAGLGTRVLPASKAIPKEMLNIVDKPAIQYIVEDLKSYCLFATHFYELTKLEEYFKNLKNYYVGYTIKNGEIKMTYKVFPGKINTSLGIELFKALNFDEETCNLLDKFQKEQEERDKMKIIN